VETIEKKVVMPRLHTDTTERQCSRCGLALEDPASKEAGVGPICRGKNNHLYAKTIDANIPMASALIFGTNISELPTETHERWNELFVSYSRKMKRVWQKNEDAFNMKMTGGDFRDEVTTLDWMLSYKLKPEVKEKLVKTVEYLGYVSLASVLSGDASTSGAKVWFDSGRIFLEGKANTAGFIAMRKIPGIIVPKYRGDKSPYSAPAANSKVFLDNVIRFWPLYEGNLEEINSLCQEWAAKNPQDKIKAAEEKLTTATIKIRSRDVVVSFPWMVDFEMREMIGRLKTVVPGNKRVYDPAAKVWNCEKSQLEKVERVLGMVFKNIKTIQTEENTPEHLFAEKAVKPVIVKRLGRVFYSKARFR
jgi:hypothetical protein